MGAHLPPALTQPQYMCGHTSHLSAPHSQGTLCSRCSQNSGAWRIMITAHVLPQFTCTVSEGSAIHPFLTERALCGKEGWKIMFVHHMFQQYLDKIYLSFNSVHSREGSHKDGALSCLDGPMYHLHLIFGIFHYKQEVFQWYSRAGKRNMETKKKKFVKKQNFIFHLHCLNCNICTYEA